MDKLTYRFNSVNYFISTRLFSPEKYLSQIFVSFDQVLQIMDYGQIIQNNKNL